VLVRPLEKADEEEIRRLDPERANPAAVSFFARTGHSFVAEEDGRPRGFVYAQPVWQGDRAVVLASALVASDEETERALLAALVKSARDAAAHEVALAVPGYEPPSGLGFSPAERVYRQRLRPVGVELER